LVLLDSESSTVITELHSCAARYRDQPPVDARSHQKEDDAHRSVETMTVHVILDDFMMFQAGNENISRATAAEDRSDVEPVVQIRDRTSPAGVIVTGIMILSFIIGVMLYLVIFGWSVWMCGMALWEVIGAQRRGDLSLLY